MAKTKKKRTGYKCGGCGERGHNARTCPKKTKTESAPVADTKWVEVPVVEEQVKAPEPKPEPQQVVVSTTQDLTADHRKKDTRPARPPAPFECPACRRCGILAIVENDIGQKLLRCEHCLTKCRPKTILKWGALPEDKPAEA